MWRKFDGTQSGFDAWRSQFGNSGSGGGEIVPEPNAIAIFLLGAFALSACRPRRT
jgi:hypothetical protein